MPSLFGGVASRLSSRSLGIATAVDVLGLGINWMIVFFALPMIFAFALRGPFGVTI